LHARARLWGSFALAVMSWCWPYSEVLPISAKQITDAAGYILLLITVGIFA
jgi:hypothetical protein